MKKILNLFLAFCENKLEEDFMEDKMENKFELALLSLQKMVDDGVIKITDNDYDGFFFYVNRERKEFGINFSFETEMEDGKNWLTWTLSDDVDFQESSFDKLGEKILKWTEEDFWDWREEELRKAISNYEQEQEDIYYMQHVR